MAGQFPKISNKEMASMLKVISKWQKSIFSSNQSWQANDLHVDEINKNFESRATWFAAGLLSLQLLTQEKNRDKLLILIPFVHFPLKDSRSKKFISSLSEKIIQKNLHEITPPSLMYVDKEYLSNKLSKQLIKCKTVESNFLSSMYYFYFRVWYDEREQMYSRELYTFLISLDTLK